MKTAQEILNELSNFTGTESYHRINPLMPNVVGTDGAVRMAELCEAFWLLDVVASHMLSVPKDEGFCVAKFIKGSPSKFYLEDGNGNEYARQVIEFTDFPLDEITLYVGRQDQYLVCMLTGEY